MNRSHINMDTQAIPLPLEVGFAPSSASSTTFDPEAHLCIQAPRGLITLEELGLSGESAISPVAITQPFPLFSAECVKLMRADLFRREVVEKHASRSSFNGCYKIRGYSQDTPFVDSVWRSEAVRQGCSQAAGMDLDIIYDYEIGHANVQFDAIADTPSITNVLPSATPPVEDDCLPGVAETEMPAIGNWHVVSYPWVCIVMLSDPSHMSGGETAFRRGDGSVLKVGIPKIGWAIMIQGGCVDHIALRAFGTGERIAMTTSCRPRDPDVRDISTLSSVKPISRCDALFQQWSSYRLDVISRRAANYKAKLDISENMTASEIRDAFIAWANEQIEYLNRTADEMLGDT